MESNFKLNSVLAKKGKALPNLIKQFEGKALCKEIAEVFCSLCEHVKYHEDRGECDTCLIRKLQYSLEEGVNLIIEMSYLPNEEYHRRIKWLKQEEVKWKVAQMELEGLKGIVIKRLIPMLSYLSAEYDFNVDTDSIVEDFDQIYHSLFYDEKETIKSVAKAYGFIIEHYNLGDEFFHELVKTKEHLEPVFKEYMDIEERQQEQDEGEKSYEDTILLFWNLGESKPYFAVWSYESKSFSIREDK
jgi:hypothetical protein